MKKFYITTPIYYVNDEPHIGHAYSTILADVLSRYHRLFGDEVFFSTGTDEHGLKVQEAAKKRGVPPKQHCDEMVTRFLDLWDKLGISYTRFIRTTEKKHKFVVRSLLTYLYEKGDIYFDTYSGKYCIPEERFWTEKDLIDGKCPSCGREVISIEEKNYFFKMSKYQEWLIEYIKETPDFIKPESRKNEILGFLRSPLSDLCISRPKTRLDWGIEIPFDKRYVTYVWFDALINYISTIGVYQDNNVFQRWWPCDIHLVGKDIVTTHAVFWPIMLKSAGFDLPLTVFAHGWWLIQEAKMSKSIGNVVKPIDLVDKYGVAGFRYVLIKNMTLGYDANFSEETLIETINSDLANDYGNLLSRINTMVQNYFDGTLPEPGALRKIDRKIVDYGTSLYSLVQENIDKIDLNSALGAILSFIKRINKYIEDTQPWNLYKNNKTRELKTVLYVACEAFRLATVFLAPILIDKAELASSAFGEVLLRYVDDVNRDLDIFKWGRLKPGTKIRRIDSLFPRIDIEESLLLSKTGKFSKENAMKNEEMISIEDFEKIDLRVGKVIEANAVKGTRKLMRLIVDLGDDKRQLIAGIADQYTAEELLGKEIVMVANLKPARIMGHESNGMILAALGNERLAIIIPQRDVEPGSKVS